MRRKPLTYMALTVLLGAAAAAASEDHVAAAAAADPRLEFLRGLAGTWVGKSGPEATSESLYEFRVTAGGHAVLEREMIGTPMEMLTVYHMDGADLVATHYCVLGNQPRLTAARRIVDDTLAFSCTGKPGNARSHDEEHVHGWSMRLDGDGRLQYSAELVESGKVSQAPSLVLTRKHPTGSR